MLINLFQDLQINSDVVQINLVNLYTLKDIVHPHGTQNGNLPLHYKFWNPPQCSTGKHYEWKIHKYKHWWLASWQHSGYLRNPQTVERMSKALIYRGFPARSIVEEAASMQWRPMYTCLISWGYAKTTSSKRPFRKIPDVRDTYKTSKPVATGLHIEIQLGRNSHKALISKPSQAYPNNSNDYWEWS